MKKVDSKLIKIIIADEIDLSGTTILNTSKFLIKNKFGISNKSIIEKFSDFNILVIRSIRKIDKTFLDNTSFKIIATCSKGTDHIDVISAYKKGVKILNAEDSNNISAAEHTLAMILSIYKNLNYSNKLVREKKFTHYEYERNEIYGKKIGIIGFGKVGSYVGKLCKAFGMDVTANDADKKVIAGNKKFKFRSLNYILRNNDIISVHIPLNKKNYKFISEEKLKLLNKKSVLINTSRGDVIDEKYLFEMLKKRKIRFEGLDVFSNEPNVFGGFAGLDNVLLTNHIAGKTIESRMKISNNIFKSINNIYK